MVRPLKDFGIKSVDYNIDDFIENGVIYGMGIKNAPTSDTNYVYICFAYANVMAWQMAKPFSGETFYIRSWTRNNNVGTWTDWKRVIPV